MPRWDTSCFYFHDGSVQTGGVDDPAKQRADQRIQLNNNVRYFPSTLPNMRTDYTVLWNPDTNPRNATFGFINQDRNNPRDFQLGLRFTF